jgi:hypothetical protein
MTETGETHKLVAQVLEDFDSCFGEPQGLPPHRGFDHHINLMSGVKPVSVRPYRYTPHQKE